MKVNFLCSNLIVETFLNHQMCFCRDSPSRLDREVLTAIKSAEVDPLKYPSIFKWKNTLKSFSDLDMQRLVNLSSVFFFLCIEMESSLC